MCVGVFMRVPVSMCVEWGACSSDNLTFKGGLELGEVVFLLHLKGSDI